MPRFTLPPSVDLFCTVIDNFGDIGVGWRLAQKLSQDHSCRVRLWVDDLHTFARLCSRIDPHAPMQHLDEILIMHWLTDFDMKGITIADIVIEAFGCALPQAYILGMAQQPQPPIWINLEYLSAEAWVPDFHLQSSPHPSYTLTKTYFFPGLTPGTGGVIKENHLEETRLAFLKDECAQAMLWRTLNIPSPSSHSTLISLFCYENENLNALLHQWTQAKEHITCIVPKGRISNTIAHFLHRPHFNVGETVNLKQLTLCSAAFVEQDDYDRLLWLCDLNFVRGEDSFVRAQWAQRPFVWQAYPQEENAHLDKLDAAMTHYAKGLPPDAFEALAHFWRVWNQAPSQAPLDWEAFWQHQNILTQHAHNWACTLSAVGELSHQLMTFCQTL